MTLGISVILGPTRDRLHGIVPHLAHWMRLVVTNLQSVQMCVDVFEHGATSFDERDISRFLEVLDPSKKFLQSFFNLGPAEHSALGL